MMFLNVFAFIFVFTLVSADDGPYIPCKSYISFSYDDSNFIRNEDFKTQINFIKNAIGTLNYPERLRSEGGYTAEFNWNSGLSIAQMQSSVDFSQQTLMPFSLLQQFASLLTSVETLNPTDDPIGALIFISDTSDRALLNADRFMTQLSNVRITFVLFGPDADQNKLTKYSNNFITWRDLSQPQPDNWDTVAAAAYGCSSSMSTVTIPNLTTPTTIVSSSATVASSSITTPYTGSTTEQYLPCQSWISFSYDDSNTLQNNDFRTQMSFISTVIGSINFPNRLRIQGAFTDVASWNSHQTIAQMQTELGSSQQTQSEYSLLMEFANLVNYLPTNDWPVGALVFISDTSDNALKNAIRFMPQLANVQLTFVLLGPNVDATKLTNFSSNFIYWTDLSQSKPDNWDTVAATAFGCSNPSSVPTIPTISTPLSSSSTIQTASTTIVTAGSTPTAPTGSTLMPYIPCQSWISFSYDDSSSLSNNDYKTQISFISTAISSINYPDRLRIDGAFTNVAAWNSHQTISQMQTELNNLQQTQNSYSLSLELANLLTDLEVLGSTNWPIGAVIFISDTSNSALANADRFISQLTGVRLTFVLLGPNVDQSKLTNFTSNFISWTDLSQPQPDNWDTVAATAFGCSNPSSVPTVPTISTQSSSTSTTQASTTTGFTILSSSATAPTGSTILPYLPCQSWISFSYDDSSSIQQSGFETQISFIASELGNLNYPDRLRVSGNFVGIAAWNSHQTIPQMQGEIQNAQQTQNSYSILLQFASLLTDVQNLQSTNWPIAALIFISDTSDSALANADNIFAQLNGTRITFVLLGTNLDQTKLTKYSSNFITWSDLSQPQPDDWLTQSFAAYGCTNRLL